MKTVEAKKMVLLNTMKTVKNQNPVKTGTNVGPESYLLYCMLLHFELYDYLSTIFAIFIECYRYFSD